MSESDFDKRGLVFERVGEKVRKMSPIKVKSELRSKSCDDQEKAPDRKTKIKKNASHILKKALVILQNSPLS